MTEWFRRKSQNIKTINKKDTQEGMWVKCPDCGEVVYSNLLDSTYYLCPSCGYHFNYKSEQYINLLLAKEDRLYLCKNLFSICKEIISVAKNNRSNGKIGFITHHNDMNKDDWNNYNFILSELNKVGCQELSYNEMGSIISERN